MTVSNDVFMVRRVQVLFDLPFHSGDNHFGWTQALNDLNRNSHYNVQVEMLDVVHGCNVRFSADLDMIPGWGHEVRDWEILVTDILDRHNVEFKNMVVVEYKAPRRQVAGFRNTTPKAGSVVQIKETYERAEFHGCFVTVTDPKSWGIQGFIAVPGQDGVREAHVRVETKDFTYIGETQR